MQKDNLKFKNKILLKKAVDFHGHLGPYLVLGLFMGEYALLKLKAKKYFALEIKVYGATNKPKSCLIDGLQLSTGCTYGKGNIIKYDGKAIKVVAVKNDNKKTVILDLKDEILKRIEAAKTHKASAKLAREIFNLNNPEAYFYVKQ